MRIDLTSLKLFVAVAEECSIAAAAVREHVVPSAVSKRLMLLEATLGVDLLVRHPKGIALTIAGETLLHRARDILRSVDATVLEVSAFTDQADSYIRLSANHSAMAHFLPRDLAGWVGSHPRTKIDLTERLSADVVRAVSTGVADVGIYCWPVIPQGLKAWPYRTDELVLAAPPAHAISARASIEFAEVAAERFIAYVPNVSVAAAMPEFLAGAWSNIRVHVANFQATCRMVEEGLGLAILPRANVQPYALQGRLACIRIEDEWALRQLSICLRQDPQPKPGLLAFVEHMVACARDEAVREAPPSPDAMA